MMGLVRAGTGRGIDGNLCGALQANDREFKEELGRIVNVDIWEDAKAKTSQQLKGMESQLWTLQGQLNRLSGIKEHMGEQV